MNREKEIKNIISNIKKYDSTYFNRVLIDNIERKPGHNGYKFKEEVSVEEIHKINVGTLKSVARVIYTTRRNNSFVEDILIGLPVAESDEVDYI